MDLPGRLVAPDRHLPGRRRGRLRRARAGLRLRVRDRDQPPRRGVDSAAPVDSRPMIYDKDADLSRLDGKTVAILGFGSQGHAHALNLKDSGAEVVVGLREDSSSVDKARGDGLRVESIADAASQGDLVMVLLPDEKQAEVWESEISDGIAPGNLLLFAH